VFVCLCRAVADSEVKRVIDEGARSLVDVFVACGAGACCGSCHEQIESMLDAADEAGGSTRLDLCARLCDRLGAAG
jgi:bacterioferritin-associated ferredoxin